MKHTKYFNKIVEWEDGSDVIQWIRENNLVDSKNGIMVQLNYDGTIRRLETTAKLTKAEKQALIDKFPELEGKEIEE